MEQVRIDVVGRLTHSFESIARASVSCAARFLASSAICLRKMCSTRSPPVSRRRCHSRAASLHSLLENPFAASVIQAIPFIWALRSAMKQERVGEQSAVECQFVYFKPCLAIRLRFRISIKPPKVSHAAPIGGRVSNVQIDGAFESLRHFDAAWILINWMIEKSGRGGGRFSHTGY
jgi:hypothetical protein